MSRRLYEPLTQVQVIGGVPQRFRWRGRRFEVRQVLTYWVEIGPWWRVGAGTSCESTFWRVEAHVAGGAVGVYDLCVAADCWLLTRVID